MDQLLFLNSRKMAMQTTFKILQGLVQVFSRSQIWLEGTINKQIHLNHCPICLLSLPPSSLNVPLSLISLAPLLTSPHLCPQNLIPSSMVQWNCSYLNDYNIIFQNTMTSTSQYFFQHCHFQLQLHAVLLPNYLIWGRGRLLLFFFPLKFLKDVFCIPCILSHIHEWICHLRGPTSIYLLPVAPITEHSSSIQLQISSLIYFSLNISPPLNPRAKLPFLKLSSYILHQPNHNQGKGRMPTFHLCFFFAPCPTSFTISDMTNILSHFPLT